MSAKIIINQRRALFRGALFKVFFDGKEVAEMFDTKTFVLEDAGVYAVQLKLKWLKTQTLIVKVEEGGTVHLSIRNGMKYYSILYLIFFIPLLSGLSLHALKIQKPEWFDLLQLILILFFIVYVLFYFIFKRGEIWILEDANKKIN